MFIVDSASGDEDHKKRYSWGIARSIGDARHGKAGMEVLKTSRGIAGKPSKEFT